MRPIVLIGAGRMGQALLAGWAQRGIAPLLAVEPSPSNQLRRFAKKHHVALFARADSIASVRAAACVLALKPQVLKSEAPRLRAIAGSGAVMISIAAGTNTATLKKAWGAHARIVRAMPNTPGAIGRGITALYAARGAGAKDKALAKRLLSALGQTLWVKRESNIDVVTAVSGSGPAYFALLAEAMIEAGILLGLSREISTQLVVQTMLGTAKQLRDEGMHPVELREMVTSPGGTTIRAIRELERAGVRAAFLNAIQAAMERSRELAGGAA